MNLYETLRKLLESWEDSYCNTGDDGQCVFNAIVEHTRIVLAMPQATFDELLGELNRLVSYDANVSA